jgi:predicted phosphohydrolase
MSYRFILGSDLHLDHLSHEERKEFLGRVRKQCDNPNAVLLLTGDISSQKYLWEHIDELVQVSCGRVFYVLGNHDFWGGSFAQANTALQSHNHINSRAVFMDLVDRVQLEDDLCVIGDSGWYDGRNGLQGNPRFIMNDWFYITNYRDNHGLTERQFSARIADARAYLLDKKLRAACDAGNKRIIILTHVPPWVEACRYMGQPSDDYALPWFSSQIIADVIDQIAKEHFHVKFEVLCGHTHDHYVYRRDNNLNVYVSGAAYGAPYVREWKPSLW